MTTPVCSILTSYHGDVGPDVPFDFTEKKTVRMSHAIGAPDVTHQDLPGVTIIPFLDDEVDSINTIQPPLNHENAFSPVIVHQFVPSVQPSILKS
jgi:hypothetical protein